MLIFVVARMRLDRYEELRRRFEVRVGGARESTGGSEPLVGRLGFVKTAVHTGPCGSYCELLDGLEERSRAAGRGGKRG
jgi:hypothetical protein